MVGILKAWVWKSCNLAFLIGSMQMAVYGMELNKSAEDTICALYERRRHME